MGVVERFLERCETMADEAAACGGGVTAYILRPGVPGWAYSFISVTANGAACLCCKQKPCPEPTTIINLQAAEGATFTMPLPVCDDCRNLKQIVAALQCVCEDLFAQPVRL